MIQAPARMGTFKIHDSAVVSLQAKLGKNVEIGPYAIIGKDVTIGNDTRIGAHTVIDGWTTIGEKCVIHSNVSIGAEPQDKKFKDEKSYVIIGDHTQIREFVTINRATGEEKETRIGSNCLLLSYSHIAHNCIIGNHVVMSNAANLAGHVELEDKVIVGGLAGVHQFVKIGRSAMVGSASKVVQDIPPFITVDGNPAQPAGLNTVGMVRSGVDEKTRRVLKRAYKILYLSGLRLPQAIEAMEKVLPPCAELNDFIRFLRKTERGICRMAYRQKYLQKSMNE